MGRAWWIRGLCFGLCVSPGVVSAQASDASGRSTPAEPPPAAESAPADAGSVDPAAIDLVDANPRALSDFRPLLDPYGAWVNDARYGLVWVPSRKLVGDDFAPYLTRGRWALDTAGSWVWVSDYEFGPVVFHYGRWVWVVGLGWAWVPGYRYGPAWVSWRVPLHDGLYVGWAPMPPSYVWVGGMAVGVGFYVGTPWVFCPSHYVFSPHVHSHHVHDPSRMKEAARQTKPYHPQVGETGPSATTAGVPKSRMPVSRVPAQPRSAPRIDTLRRYTPASEASKWQVLGDRPGPVPLSGQPRAAPRSLPASERVGAHPPPNTLGVRVQQPKAASLLPRTTQQGGMHPSNRGFGPNSMIAPRAMRVPVGPTPQMQGQGAVPRALVVPRAAAPLRAPGRPAPAVRSTR